MDGIDHVYPAQSEHCVFSIVDKNEMKVGLELWEIENLRKRNWAETRRLKLKVGGTVPRSVR